MVGGPDAVVDLLEAETIAAEGLAREDSSILPLHHPVVSDLSCLQMAYSMAGATPDTAGAMVGRSWPFLPRASGRSS